jgi:hypothetical protein
VASGVRSAQQEDDDFSCWDEVGPPSRWEQQQARTGTGRSSPTMMAMVANRLIVRWNMMHTTKPVTVVRQSDRPPYYNVGTLVSPAVSHLQWVDMCFRLPASRPISGGARDAGAQKSGSHRAAEAAR